MSEVVNEEQSSTATDTSFLSARLMEQLKNKRMIFSKSDLKLSTAISQGLCASCFGV